MAVLVTLDGELHDADLPLLSADDLGAVRGDGVFETLLVRKGQACVLQLHLDRLVGSARALELPAPDRDAWQLAVEIAVEHWYASHEGSVEGLLRLVLTRGRESGGPPTSYVWIDDVPSRVAESRKKGVAVITLERGYSVDLSARAPWALLGAKTLSYATNMAALRHARSLQADDAIFVSSEGYVLESPRASVVTFDGERFVTPPATAGVLMGTTTLALFELASRRGIECHYKPMRVVDLFAAQSVWLLSSVTLAARVHTVNGALLPRDGNPDFIAGLVDEAVITIG